MSLWSMCLGFSMLLILALIIGVIRYRHILRLAIPMAMAGVIAATTILVLPYYLATENPVAGFLNSLLVSLKIFIMNESLSEITRVARSNLAGFQADIYSVLLALLFLAAPLLTAGFIFEFLGNFFAHIVIQRKKKNEIFLFSELNNRSIMLARSIRNKSIESGIKANIPVIAFTGTQQMKKPENLDLIEQAREARFLCIRKRSESLNLNSGQKITFIQIAENEDKNLNSTLTLIEKYRSYTNRDICILVFSSQPEAEILLDSADKGQIKVRVIDESQIVAYHLFDQIPLYQADVTRKNKISILIVASVHTGMQILKTAAWCGQIDGLDLEINIIDIEADRWESEFTFQCPELMSGEYNIVFHKAHVLTTKFENILRDKCGDANYIIVTLGQDDLNIKTSLYLRRHYLSSDPDYQNWPVVTLLIRDEEKYRVVSKLKTSSKEKRDLDLHPFGSIEKLYSYDVMLDSELDKLALNVHASYESNSNPQIKRENVVASMNKYQLYRRSNVANALHIKYKLWSLGLGYTRDDSELPEIGYELTTDIKHRLVQLEHRRWNAFQRSEGWRSVTSEQVRKYMLTGLNDGHRHFIAKLHPCICEFEKLVALCEEFDPKFIQYDEDYIENMQSLE